MRQSGGHLAGGTYVVNAEQAASSGASHIGALAACPVAMVAGAGPQLDQALDAYRLQQRLGIRPEHLSARMASAMLVIDEEAAALRSTELRRWKALHGSAD